MPTVSGRRSPSPPRTRSRGSPKLKTSLPRVALLATRPPPAPNSQSNSRTGLSKNGQPSLPKTVPELPAETQTLVQLPPNTKTAPQESQRMGATSLLAERSSSDEVCQICIAEDRSLGEEVDALRSEMKVRLDTEVAIMESILDDKVKVQNSILEFIQSSMAHLRTQLNSNLDEEVHPLRQDVNKFLEQGTGDPVSAARFTTLGVRLTRLEADRLSEALLQQVKKTPPVNKGQEEAMEVPRCSKNLKEKKARRKSHMKQSVRSEKRGKTRIGRTYKATYGEPYDSGNSSSSDSSSSDSSRHDRGYDRTDDDTGENSNSSSEDSTARRRHCLRKSKSATKGSRKSKVLYAVPVIHRRQKAPKHKGLNNLRPTNPLYEDLLSYRSYRLWNPSYHRTSRGTGKFKDHIKRWELTIRGHLFNGVDPIRILDFLPRFVTDASTLKMNEAKACIALPYFLSRHAEERFNSVI